MLKISTAAEVDKIELCTIGCTGHGVLWDRAGEVRLIPWPVIRNANQLFHSWEEAEEAGVIEEVPESACYIHWESCLGLPARSSVVKVKLLEATNAVLGKDSAD